MKLPPVFFSLYVSLLESLHISPYCNPTENDSTCVTVNVASSIDECRLWVFTGRVKSWKHAWYWPLYHSLMSGFLSKISGPLVLFLGVRSLCYVLSWRNALFSAVPCNSASIKWVRPKNHSRATKSLWFKASRWELQIRNSSQLSRYRSTQPVKASFVVIVDVDVGVDVIWRRLFKERIPLLVFF